MNKHTPKESLTSYDSDFYQWSLSQAALVRARRFNELDIENIAEEIESLGRSDKRALGSQLRRLMTHLLKWQKQQSRRSQSWRSTIDNSRDELRVIVDESPSLRAALAAAIAFEYVTARKRAVTETKMAEENFPAVCPYTQDQILDDDFWPSA